MTFVIPMQNSTKIRQLREEVRLSQAELADKINVSLKTIQRIEKGENEADLKHIISIAKLFKVHPATLDDSLDFSQFKEEKQGENMSGVGAEDLLRAHLIMMACNMPGDSLKQAIRHLEAMSDSEESKKNLEKVS